MFVPAPLVCRTSSSSSPRRRPPVDYPLGIPVDTSDGFKCEACDFPPVAAVLTLPGLTGAPGSRAGTAGSGAARAATAGGACSLRLGSASDGHESHRSLPSSARTLSRYPSPKQKPTNHLISDSSNSSLNLPLMLDPSITPVPDPKPFVFNTPMDSALNLVHQAAGRPLHTLHIADIRHSCNLQSELAQLKLDDYFDERGGLRLRRLGFTVAAKQYPDIKDTFGSSVEEEVAGVANKKNISARSIFSSTQALMKDMSASEKRKQQQIDSTDEAEKVQTKDVQQRQLEMFFLEVPDFAQYVPPEVKLLDLLPAYVDRENEIRERRTQEKVTASFSDTRWVEGSRMGWMMVQDEALLLADLASRWSKASRHSDSTVGMDRSTFCKFILDLGLVDQKKVPFYWAVSLFDAAAQPMRCCPQDATWACSAPAALMVNRWTLMSILDTLLRQHFDFQSKDRFFLRLRDIAKQKLPRHLLEGLIEENDVALNPAHLGVARHRDGATSNGSSSGNVSPIPETGARTSRDSTSSRDKQRNRAPSPQRHNIQNRPSPSPPNRKGGEHGQRKLQVHVNGIAHETAQRVSAHQEVAKQRTVAPWLQSPETSGSNVEAKLGRLARDRLHNEMLLEPEVLHLVAQYHLFFLRIHRLYADNEGNLSFASLLQFTTDFQLTPQLVPSDTLKTMYESSQCLEPRLNHEPEAEETPAPLAMEATLSCSSRGSMMTDQTPRSNKSSSSKASFEQPSQVEARSSTIKDAANKSLKRRLILKNKACNIFRSSSCNSKLQLSGSAEHAEDDVKEVERPISSHKHKVLPSLFGVTSLMETLCKMAFLRLGCYGNTAQKSSSAYARVVWMIAYLRCVFDHLRKSAERHSTQGHPVPVQGTLQQVLDLTLDVWRTPRKTALVASRDFQLLPTFLQPMPGIGVPKRSRSLTSSEVKKLRGRGVTLQPSIPDHWHQVRTAVIAVDFTRKLKQAVERRRSSVKPPEMQKRKTGRRSREDDDVSDEEPVEGTGRAKGSGKDDSSSGAESEEDPYATKKAGYDRCNFPVNPHDFSAVQKGRRLSAGIAIEKCVKAPKKQEEAVFTLDELFVTEAGVPSILDGLCRLCGHKGGKDWWGNPKCRGCSIVDSLAFQHHPFHALLQDSPSGPKLAAVVAELPPSIDRCNLTPPLLGSLGQMYRDEFGHVG